MELQEFSECMKIRLHLHMDSHQVSGLLDGAFSLEGAVQAIAVARWQTPA